MVTKVLKKKRFHYYRILSKNLPDFWQEKFGRFVKNAIWVSRGTVWEEKHFFAKKNDLFARFWTSSQTVSTPWRKFVFNTVVEFAFYVSSGIVWEKKTLKKLILIQFPNSSERFAISGKKNSVGSSYLMSRCPEESFEENIFFPKDKKFWSFSFVDRKLFRLLGKDTSSGLSKRHSTCPRERFD